MNFDAYTIRKMAPRLLVAVVAVNISIYLCLAAVDLTAVLGGGISQLLQAPFNNTSIGSYKLGGGGEVAGGIMSAGLGAALIGAFWVGGGVAGGAAIVGVGALFLLALILIPLVLIGAALFVALAYRQAMLMFLIITSPVAIALFVLPGTEKYFRQWLKLFAGMLALYPIIAAIFAMSNIMVGLILGG